MKISSSRPLLLVLTVILTACQGAPTPSPSPSTGGSGNHPHLGSSPSLTLSFVEGMDFTDGYDSTTGNYLGYNECFVSHARPVLPNPSDLKSTFTFFKTESKEDIAKALNVDGKATYSTGATKISASAQFAQEQETTKYNVGLLLKVDVTDQTYAIYNTQEKPELTEMARNLYDTDYQKFKDTCGDYYLNAMTLGGRYVAYFDYTTYSEAQKSKIAAQLSASAGPFTLSADFSKKMQSLTSNSTLKISTFQTGIPMTPGVTLDELISDAQDYEKKLRPACATAEGLKKCVNTVEFVSYAGAFGPPETKSTAPTRAAVAKGSFELTTLVQRGNLIDNLIGSRRLIESNPNIYDEATRKAIEPNLKKADTWKKIIDVAIEACNIDITTCLPSSVAPDGAEAQAERLYGEKLLPYKEYNDMVDGLPDVTAKLPASCSDQQKIYNQTTDGDYVVFLDHDLSKSFRLYCKDMIEGKTPLDYLSLGSQNRTRSIQDNTKDINSPDYSGVLVTEFTKIKINPDTLNVKIDDITFSESIGNVINEGDKSNTPRPLGFAGVCTHPDYATNVKAYIDLINTDMIFDSDQTELDTMGTGSGGGGSFSENGKLYTIDSGKTLDGYRSCKKANLIMLRLKLSNK